MQTLTAEDADRVATIAQGEEFAIALDENPTTGFRWTIASITNTLSVVSSEFTAPDSSRAGAGGRRTVRLRAERPGDGELQFQSRRPGAGDAPSARDYSFRFVVTPA
jgi:inhibitor of cysteine peptidase